MTAATMFPEIIVVRYDDDLLIVCDNDLSDVDDGLPVATYARMNIGHVEVQREFVAGK